MDDALFPPTPPSVLPDISPSRGEIDSRFSFCPNEHTVLSLQQGFEAVRVPHPISPLEGEMPGRAEGGALAETP
jgi:hypothetical protein